jgi:hypothetical protein
MAMTVQFPPITPPPELRDHWRTKAPIYRDSGVGRENWLMDSAAQWGWDQRGTINEAQLQERADQELEACCEWVSFHHWPSSAERLRAARRPKPPSLKEQALEALGYLQEDEPNYQSSFDTIRRALEALPND